MASSPITSWQVDGETMETETFFLGAPKSLQMVTAAIFKSRDISLPTKVHLVKAMVFFQQSCMDVRVGLKKTAPKN